MATTVSSLSFGRETSNYDEVSMHQSLLFADSLKDLKNLRTQLYSAAEYFELSFTNDDQKHMVIETLKGYAINALVNTVDHLGSVTYKVNDLLEEKIREISTTDLRISCIEQKLQTCRQYMNHEGRFQQSSAVSTPKYHKRYNLPDSETLNGASHSKSKYHKCSMDHEDDGHQLKIAVQKTVADMPTPTTTFSDQCLPSPLTHSFTRSKGIVSKKPNPKADQDKRTISPHRFPLFRSGSLASRPTTPNPSRPISPRISVDRRRSPSEPRKSASMRMKIAALGMVWSSSRVRAKDYSRPY